MTKYKLAANPTSPINEFVFEFATSKEMKAYTQFETARTGPEFAALGASLTLRQREAAKEALAAKRKAIYKLWKEQQKPMVKSIA